MTTPLWAETLQQQAAALKVIRDTAADICQVAPIEQSSQNVDLSGNAKAKLSGAISKVVDIGISGAAKYNTGRSKGVLQKDLAAAIRDGNDCKRDVFNRLTPIMVPAPSPPGGESHASTPTLFNKPTGYFKKQGSLWLEFPPYGPNQYFTFRDTGSDGNYVYLVDPTRTKPGDQNNAMIVRLPIRGGSAQWSYQNPVAWIDFTVITPG
ncbi:MAG: hypothetical protein ACRYG4_25590 [Janthinobacterium lividum]